MEQRIDELYDLYMKVRDEIELLRQRYDIALALMTDEQRDMLTRVLMAVEGYKPKETESGTEEGGPE
jgi:hypothetical protein